MAHKLLASLCFKEGLSVNAAQFGTAQHLQSLSRELRPPSAAGWQISIIYIYIISVSSKMSHIGLHTNSARAATTKGAG